MAAQAILGTDPRAGEERSRIQLLSGTLVVDSLGARCPGRLLNVTKRGADRQELELECDTKYRRASSGGGFAKIKCQIFRRFVSL